ncbi:MAG: double zinc ribbon domain-containing protein [Bacteroidales bacterium]|nr:double zinc ribbon domain-containing protein [Bacteroidales bacterium]
MTNPLRDILRILFPPTCYHCGKELVSGERYLCMDCQLNLPITHNAHILGNETELRVGGRIPVEAGASLLYYQKGMVSRELLHHIKYYGHYKMATDYGAMLGIELSKSGRFEQVDYLVPVPLHWYKKWQRGYNQSEYICKGIQKHFERPICSDVLYRKRYTRTQTHKSHEKRMDNMADVFGVRNNSKLENKHILLVDDVITSGATTDACWSALKTTPGIHISIASLAIATSH